MGVGIAGRDPFEFTLSEQEYAVAQRRAKEHGFLTVEEYVTALLLSELMRPLPQDPLKGITSRVQ